MDKLHRDVLRVTGAASISHDPELAPGLKARGHLLAELADLFGIVLKEFLFYLHRLAALVHDFAAPFFWRNLRRDCRRNCLAHAAPPRLVPAALRCSSSFLR